MLASYYKKTKQLDDKVKRKASSKHGSNQSLFQQLIQENPDNASYMTSSHGSEQKSFSKFGMSSFRFGSLRSEDKHSDIDLTHSRIGDRPRLTNKDQTMTE